MVVGVGGVAEEVGVTVEVVGLGGGGDGGSNAGGGVGAFSGTYEAADN